MASLHRLKPAPGGARWLPPCLGLATTATGMVNVASALTPNLAWRGHRLLSLDVIHAVPIFHALALPLGALLIVLGIYLARRRRRACYLALPLLVAMGLINVLKGLDVDEALLGWGVAALLWWGRGAFAVEHEPIGRRTAFWAVPGLALGATALGAVAVWASRSTPEHPDLSLVLHETLDLLLWLPGPMSFHHEFRWLPTGVGLVGLGTLLALAYVLFRPLAAPRSLPDPHVRRLVGQLIRRHGEDTLAFFHLREDRQYLFSADRRAFVGYRVANGVLLIAGDPVGPDDAVPALLDEVLAFARSRGLKVAALGAGERLLPVYRRAGLRPLYIGDESIVVTERFSLEGRSVKKVRQAVNRVARCGYTAELRRLDDLDEDELAVLERVSDAWREGVPERGFSMAMDSLRAEGQGESLVVIARDGDGAVRGFLHFVPSYGRAAMSLSFMRRERDTPNGVTEFLVVRSIELLRERGVQELSLNFAAFARWLYAPTGPLQRALGRVVRLGNPFFQIESLYRFNARFFPRWEPRYLLFEGSFGVLRAALAALWAEGQLPRPRLRRGEAVPGSGRRQPIA
ncbi:MAG: lysyl-tRNA synthetase, class [Solirubrobacteraceae bacterium]|jgi:lysyl-tRNA synthetase class 2|nr:lysyl-tRNA synthetase, class [Solirubrobacteraceae bacterium]MEA2395927.1 lysyl-tRNA synthetase, class [Solirubrobacteraceae bacterium]